MQNNIHPDYHAIKVTCSCGNILNTRSTIHGDALSIEICSQCHPFYTGKQKNLSADGRTKKFQEKYARFRKSGDSAA